MRDRLHGGGVLEAKMFTLDNIRTIATMLCEGSGPFAELSASMVESMAVDAFTELSSSAKEEKVAAHAREASLAPTVRGIPVRNVRDRQAGIVGQYHTVKCACVECRNARVTHHAGMVSEHYIAGKPSSVEPLRNEHVVDMLRPSRESTPTRASKEISTRYHNPRTRDGSDPCERPIGKVATRRFDLIERKVLRLAILAVYNGKAKAWQKRLKRGSAKALAELIFELISQGWTCFDMGPTRPDPIPNPIVDKVMCSVKRMASPVDPTPVTPWLDCTMWLRDLTVSARDLRVIIKDLPVLAVPLCPRGI